MLGTVPLYRKGGYPSPAQENSGRRNPATESRILRGCLAFYLMQRVSEPLLIAMIRETDNTRANNPRA